MKLVIDIPESIYDTIQADEMISREQLAVLQMHILNGKPLTEIIESIKDKILDNYDNSKGDGVREECLDIIDNAIYGGRHYADADKGEQE